MEKARIRHIGVILRGDARPIAFRQGDRPVATGWHIEGGDYPGIDYTAGLLGAWSVEELDLISQVERVWPGRGYELAEAVRLNEPNFTLAG